MEGRWSGTNHKAAVTTGSSGLGFSSTVIDIIKQGVVYPDKSSDWTKGRKHPWWHGRWQTVSETIKKVGHSNANWDVNYVAALEMISDIALEGGSIKSYMTYDYYYGMDSDTYAELRNDISLLQNKFGSILSSNTKANRKYFLYG